MKSFVVFIQDTIPEPRAINVRWYNTKSQLQRAARREASKYYENAMDKYHGVVGLFTPIERWQITPGQPDQRHPDFGIIRLCREYNQGSTVIHEMTHAAQALYAEYFVDVQKMINTDLAIDHMTSNNETFAMIMTELYHRIISELYETNFFDPVVTEKFLDMKVTV